MAELVQDNWILLVIALIVALLVAWWLFAATRRTRVEIERQDDAEPTPAKRNQALIDAPPAATAALLPPATPIGMVGIGEAVAAATLTAPPEPEPSPLPFAPLPVDLAPLNSAPLDPEPISPEPQPEQPAAPAAAALAPRPPQSAPSPEAVRALTPATAQGPSASEAPPVFAPGEELVRIKGLGPRLADQLRALGITSLAQIAAWDDAEIDRIDAQLGRFQGRIRRDNWPEQARLLTGGDVSAYEARFGKL